MIEMSQDIFLFKNSILPEQEKKLSELYLENELDFYVPVLKSGHKMHLKMLCFGRHWNAKTYKYSYKRDDIDARPVLNYPLFINDIARSFSIKAFPYFSTDWDILICNYYEPLSGRLGLHKDNSESQKTLDIGHPVVSISLGATCLFEIDGIRIILENGDVLVFGGKARLARHGVIETYNDFSSRLNFTLRKF